MQPAIFDHLIALFIVAVMPVLAVTRYRRFVAQVRSGVPGIRLRTYRQTIATQWALAAAVLLAWRVAGMDDLRWRKLTASHELEVILLKSILEQRREREEI